MSFFSLFAFAVYAAESVISPLPDAPIDPPRPKVSFAQLTSPSASGQVLGTASSSAVTVTPPPTPSPTLLVSSKKQVTIALLGDSMIDTLGPDAPHLKNKLTSLFPSTRVTVVNYGVGATNIEYGLERLTNAYTYLGRQMPSLVSTHPDIVVVESFGYNPLSQPDGALERHWLDLAKVVDTLKSQLPGVRLVIAATIAPNAKVFGDGANGLAFTPEDKWKRVDVIKKYLESTVKFAQSQHLPLADAFHPSLQADGNGNIAYINAGDHIHYSDAGRSLFADKVAQAIVANNLLQ